MKLHYIAKFEACNSKTLNFIGYQRLKKAKKPPDITIEKSKARNIKLAISSERVKIFSFHKMH